MSTLPIIMGLLLECLVAGYVSGQRAIFEDPYKEQTISAKIRAVSISIHAGGQNQDVYLAEIISKSDGRRLAKLIDVYAPEDSRIDQQELKLLPMLRMQVRRSPFCDVTANQFFLSNKSVIFDDAVKEDLSKYSSTTLPCYQISHRSIRFR